MDKCESQNADKFSSRQKNSSTFHLTQPAIIYETADPTQPDPPVNPTNVFSDQMSAKSTHSYGMSIIGLTNSVNWIYINSHIHETFSYWIIKYDKWMLS